jgi:hypothetical protein
MRRPIANVADAIGHWEGEEGGRVLEIVAHGSTEQ